MNISNMQLKSEHIKHATSVRVHQNLNHRQGRTDLWRMSMAVDVLMSFAQSILNLDVIVSDASIGDTDSPTYMSGNVWQTTVKTKTDVIQFPSGLLDDGEYILITSGGIAS